MRKSLGTSFKPSEICVYIRVNSLDQIRSTAMYTRCAAQDASGEKLRKQTAAALTVANACELTVENKNIVAEYGSTDDLEGRPGRAVLQEKIEIGEVKTLGAESLNLLARNPSYAGKLIRMFTDRGCG